MDHEYGAGSFLIANPVLPDPNFSRTVVLLCNHDQEGSFGLVVNRKSDLKAPDIFAGSDVLEFYSKDIFIGGPVQQSQVFFLCRLTEPFPGLEEVCAGVHLGMSRDVLEEVVQNIENPQDDLRFYLGYSGWGSGQLAGEMDQRSWLTCDATKEFIFQNPNDVWANAVRSKGKEYEYLLNAPVDPRCN